MRARTFLEETSVRIDGILSARVALTKLCVHGGHVRSLFSRKAVLDRCRRKHRPCAVELSSATARDICIRRPQLMPRESISPMAPHSARCRVGSGSGPSRKELLSEMTKVTLTNFP